jgi:predicted amidohydrolase YtcJ
MPALQAYTTNPAIAAHVSDHLGMLKAGYVADLACLSENPMMVPPNALYNNRVTGVMLAGKWLFQKK